MWWGKGWEDRISVGGSNGPFFVPFRKANFFRYILLVGEMVLQECKLQGCVLQVGRNCVEPV